MRVLHADAPFLAGEDTVGAAPIAVGTSGYPDNDQAGAWFEGP